MPRPTGSHSFKAAMYAGGTSVAGTRRRSLWIAAAVLAAVAAGIALAILVGGARGSGGGDQAAAPADADEGAEPAGEPAGETRLDPGPSAPRGAPRPASPAAGEAARDLGLALRSERLWSTVAIDRTDPSVVIIRSSLCADEALQRAVDGMLGEIGSRGVTAVRCLAPHGSVVFEKAP